MSRPVGCWLDVGVGSAAVGAVPGGECEDWTTWGAAVGAVGGTGIASEAGLGTACAVGGELIAERARGGHCD